MAGTKKVRPTWVAMRVAKTLTPLMQRMTENLRRALHLVSIYRDLYGKGKGRRSIHKADLLRAAVVFLHATLEDFLRSIAALYLPAASKDALNNVPLAGFGSSGRPEKFFLGQLVDHRGKTVDELIAESITEHLARANFNNTSDIVGLLESIGFEICTDIRGVLPDLQSLMQRRHKIVHRADRQEARGRGLQKASSLSSRDVERWIQAIRVFSVPIIACIIDREMEACGVDVAQLDRLLHKLKAPPSSLKKSLGGPRKRG